MNICVIFLLNGWRRSDIVNPSEIKLAMQQYNHYYEMFDNDYLNVKVEDFSTFKNDDEIIQAIKGWAEACEDNMLDLIFRTGAIG